MDASSKGIFLSGGIACISTGTAMLVTEKWWIGLIMMACGVGIIFAREYLKEQ